MDISNYINYKVWDRITYPFPNFNHEACDYLSMLGLITLHVNKRGACVVIAENKTTPVFIFLRHISHVFQIVASHSTGCVITDIM